MDRRYLEEVWIRHAAPTLAGLKCASMLNLRAVSPDLLEALNQLETECFHPMGLRIFRMKQEGDRCLVLLYRRDLLFRRLSEAKCKRMLRDLGYPEFSGVEDLPKLLEELRRRIGRKEFPHETGLFLDYPTRDVEAFIREGGKNYLCLGPWKVYYNLEDSIERFRLFDRCRQWFQSGYEAGIPLQGLLPKFRKNAGIPA